MRVRESINIWNGIKVGDSFVITSCPSKWSSGLNSNYPLDDVKFPYKGIIMAMEIEQRSSMGEENFIVNMTDGKWGWALDVLLKEKKITCLRLERKKKLKCIKNKGVKNI